MTNKDKAAVIVKEYSPAKSGDDSDDDAMSAGKDKAVSALFSAIEKKDKGAFRSALEDFYEMCGE